MKLLKQSTAYNLMILMVDSADHITGKEGLTLTITASKDGAAFASISPTVTERGNGWYNLALTTSHTNMVGDLAIHVTSAGADPTDVSVQIRALVTDDLARPVNLVKNVGFANFAFVMLDMSGSPVTGLTVTATRSIDGAAFAACANSPAEVASGVYKITLSAGDLNGGCVVLKFSAASALDTIITVVTNS